MSATRDFSRWAKEVANDPRYPVGLPKDAETVALYVTVAEALAESADLDDPAAGRLAFAWMPSTMPCRDVWN